MSPARAVRFIGLAIAVSLTGCAQTRLSHEPGLVATWNRQPLPATSSPAKLTLMLYTRYLEFDQPSDPSIAKWWSKHKVRHQLEDVIGEFPFLTLATSDGIPPEDRVVVEATHAIRGNKFLNTISQSTHYLIPSSARGVIELDARVYRTNQPPTFYEAVGTYAIKRHALFLALPFLWGYKVPARTMEDTFRDLFLQIQRDLIQ
jgi:hypothetical protein